MNGNINDSRVTYEESVRKDERQKLCEILRVIVLRLDAGVEVFGPITDASQSGRTAPKLRQSDSSPLTDGLSHAKRRAQADRGAALHQRKPPAITDAMKESIALALQRMGRAVKPKELWGQQPEGGLGMKTIGMVLRQLIAEGRARDGGGGKYITA